MSTFNCPLYQINNPLLCIEDGNTPCIHLHFFESFRMANQIENGVGEALTIQEGEIQVQDAFQTERPRMFVAQRVTLTYKTEAKQFSVKVFAALPRDQGVSTVTGAFQIPRSAVARGAVVSRK